MEVYPCGIFKSNLDGTEVTAIVSTGMADVMGIATDFSTSRIYWNDDGKYDLSGAGHG